MSQLSVPNRLTRPVTERDHAQEPMDAAVVLVEYGDYQCPHCGEAYSIVKAIQQQLGDQLCFVFRHFPLTQIHSQAQKAAEAVEVAAAQGMFWQIHDTLFERMYSIQALWTAAQHRLPIVFVVPRNDQYAILKAFAEFEQVGHNIPVSQFLNVQEYSD